MSHVALHWIALHFFHDGRVLVGADVQLEHRVETGRARERDTQLFAVDGDGQRLHSVAVDDAGDLVLGEQAAGGGASERTTDLRF